MKNWHLMAYNWNTLPEIGPQKQSWVHTQWLLPGAVHTMPGKGAAHHSRQE